MGNLETGGTGKTQVVSYIVRQLMNSGKNVAVISRGYGRSTKGFLPVDTDSTAMEVGDEPLMLKRRHPEAMVAVCEKRAAGIGKLLELNPELDYVVMDDGFQHRWVKPKLSILVTNAGNPYRQNWLLPVGSLREPASGSARADVFVKTGVEGISDSWKDEPSNVYPSNSVIEEVIQVSGTPLELATGMKVMSFSGIANDLRFVHFIRDRYELLEHVPYPDHHHYTESDVRRLREKMDSFGAGLEAVITTEKDAVRLVGTSLLDRFGSTPVFYLKLDLQFLFGTNERFERLILHHGEHA